MNNVNLIVAISDNNVIGCDNDLPWRIKEDLKYFKEKTTDGVVIMGRNTFESMGSKPLKNRINIILSSRSADLFPQDVTAVDNITDAISIAKEYNKDIWIIGGVGVYEASIKEGLVDKLYVTRVRQEYEGDTFFPEINWDELKLVGENEVTSSDGIILDFQVWEGL